MTLIFIGAVVVLACFASVLLVGAPYVPTLKSQVDELFKVGKIRPGQTMIELGCGDGKVVVAGARRGVNIVAYELNPLLFAFSWIRTRKYRKNVKIIWGDFWKKDWPEADVIFAFLLPKYMEKLDTKIVQYKHKPVKCISFAFDIPSKKTIAESAGLHVYHYD